MCVFFIHSFADGHLGCFYVLAIVNNAAITIGIHVPFWISGLLFQICTKEWNCWVIGSSIVSFLRKLHNVFHCAYAKLHSHQQYARVPFSIHPHQHLLLVFFSIIAVLMDVKWHLMFFSSSVPWLLVVLSIFSCECWSLAFPLWKNICSGRPLIFTFFFLSCTELCELFVHFWC